MDGRLSGILFFEEIPIEYIDFTSIAKQLEFWLNYYYTFVLHGQHQKKEGPFGRDGLLCFPSSIRTAALLFQHIDDGRDDEGRSIFQQPTNLVRETIAQAAPPIPHSFQFRAALPLLRFAEASSIGVLPS